MHRRRASRAGGERRERKENQPEKKWEPRSACVDDWPCRPAELVSRAAIVCVRRKAGTRRQTPGAGRRQDRRGFIEPVRRSPLAPPPPRSSVKSSCMDDFSCCRCQAAAPPSRAPPATERAAGGGGMSPTARMQRRSASCGMANAAEEGQGGRSLESPTMISVRSAPRLPLPFP